MSPDDNPSDQPDDQERLREERRLSAELILGHLAEVESLLRATCTHETTLEPIDAVVAELVSTASRLGEARPRPTR